MTGPVSDAALAVARWLAAVFDDADLASAWPLTDEQLRLALAQSWVMLEGDRADVAAVDRDALAGSLAEADQPASPFWAEFSGWRIIRWRQVLPDFVTDVAIRGTVSGEYPEAPGIEAVWVTHVDNPVVEGKPIAAQRFLARQTDGAWACRGHRRGASGARVATHRVTPALTGNLLTRGRSRRCPASATLPPAPICRSGVATSASTATCEKP